MDEQEKKIRIKLRDDYPHYASKCLTIRTKNDGLEKFLLNTAQQHIHEIIENQKRSTTKVRVIILKGRQQGVSTYVAGRFYHQVTHRIGCRAFVLTHDSDATNNLFDMTQRYHQNCPKIVRPEIDVANAKELYFGGLDSGFKVGTAGNKKVGRSQTIQLFHGCLAEGTKIFDPVTGGLLNIEDFSIGENIRTHTGNISPISFISSQRKECLEVTLRGLTAFPLTATPNHRFWTKQGWKKLENFKSDDVIGYPIKQITKDILYLDLPPATKRSHGGGRQFICPDKIKINYKLGRLIGLYLAEGYIKLQAKKPNNPAYLSFAVHRKEVERTVKWLSPFANYFSSMKINHREDSLTSTITIYGNRLAFLINNICGRTTNKHLPLNWDKLGKDFGRGLLHGYIAGDGHSDDQCRRVRASSICSAITVSMRDLVASLGYGWASIEYKPPGIRHGRNEKERFTFSLCGNGASILANEIGKITPKIVNKKTKSTKQYAALTTEISNGYAWLRIKDIKYAGMRQVYDFEIDDTDHSYCTIHGATHNSEVAFWGNAIDHAKGILQAVPDSAETEIIFESTANGTGNYFHEQWQLAQSGESDFIPIFVPWYWQSEYKKEITEDFELKEDEYELVKLYDLNPSQLLWRRSKITQLSVGGVDGKKAFQQEYPNNAIEAFQLSGEDGFISPEIVYAARKCQVLDPYGALIVGVDPARFGNDRCSIIRRKGRVAYNLQSYTKKDTMEIVGMCNSILINEKPDKMFVDIGGLGAGIVDRLHELGHGDIVVGINFGSVALDQDRYNNKRSEMWGLMNEWLRTPPVQIPDKDSLHADLCGIKYKIDSQSRLVMESGEDMKKRGIRSPDEASALMLTFAMPVEFALSRKKKANEKAARVMGKSTHEARIRDLYGLR
jgi:hypothetical protein